MKSFLELEYNEKRKNEFLSRFKNIMNVPKIQKVVLSGGIASLAKANKKNVDFIKQEITQICNQKPILVLAKQSCDGFNIKKNDINAFKVTLRGTNMYEFLGKLIHFVLPRTRNFFGLNIDSLDKRGNFNFGISDISCFSEIDKKHLNLNFGFHINITTTASNKEDALILLTGLGFPLRKVMK